MNEFLRRLLFLPGEASTEAKRIDWLHYSVILTTMAGAVLVTVVGLYFLVKYRRRPGEGSTNPGATARPPVVLELTAIFGLLGLFLTWWYIGAQEFVRIRVPPQGAMTIYVTAKQWMWKFAYPEGNRSITTLYVPVRRPVELIMTSRDVIHSFYVPDFRVKQDVVPGRYTTMWFEAPRTGTFPILCAEYCGTGHSTMRGEVVVLEEVDYERWLSGQTEGQRIAGQSYIPPAVPGEASPAQMLSLVEIGLQKAAEHGCLRCHTTDGTPHIGPTWAGLYDSPQRLDNGQQVIADDAYLTESMMDPQAKVVAGFNPLMPSYRGRLDSADTAAILELIRSLRDVAPEPANGGVP